MANPNSITVANGGLVVTGNLTSFVAAEGDHFIADGYVGLIASGDSTSQLTLKRPWAGPTLTDWVAWDISNVGPYWQSTASLNKRMTDLIAKWEVGTVKWDAAGTLAGRDTYNNQDVGFVYLCISPQPFRLYAKLANTNSAADWSPGQIVGGVDIGTVGIISRIQRLDLPAAPTLSDLADGDVAFVRVTADGRHLLAVRVGSTISTYALSHADF
jgi:hypothetical protein